MSTIKEQFDITGMSCAACSAHVEKSVRKLSGIDDVKVNLLENSMVAVHDESVTANDIINAVKSGGYGASLHGVKKSAVNGEDSETDVMKKRLIYSVCFLIPLMYVSMGHMINAPFTEFFMQNEYLAVYALTQLLLTLPVIFINFKFFRSGTKAVLHGAPNMDTLVASGSAAALIYGIYSLYCICIFSGKGDFHTAHGYAMNLYFESSAMILTLITVGKYLEARAKKHTSDAVSALMKLAPQEAHVIRDGKELTVSAEELITGDEIIVKTGESIPCDGTVTGGSGLVDESAVTGESIPVTKESGDKLTGATILKSGYLTFRAEAVGKDTMFAKIIELVRSAAADKAPVARIADKVCGVFVPAVMLIALITFIIWLILGKTVGEALGFAISVLVISCPCALGLATPTAIMAGTGRGAQMGILFKTASALETLAGVQAVVTDKTGTLTYGKPTVTDIIPFESTSEDELISLAASLESKSEHPLSMAILEKAGEKALSDVTDFSQISGGGISGKINGKELLAGNAELLYGRGISFEQAENLSAEGKTVLYFAYDGKYIGLIAVSDLLKEDSATAVAELKKSGVEVTMLTGDNETTAKAIAEKAGIESVIAGVKPDDKESAVRELMADGKITAMVGDGINDAPALARADIGIAVGGGTDAAIDSADVILMHGNFSDCVKAVGLSRAVMRNIKQNLFWAFFYNVLGIPVAAGVLFSRFGIKLNPMIGSFAMSLSSLFVVSNALRLRYFGKKEEINHMAEKNILKGDNNMEKTMKIEGMMCSHCTGRVSEALNAIDGVTATVSLDDGGKAVISLKKDVDDAVLTKAVTDAGYKVTKIE